MNQIDSNFITDNPIYDHLQGRPVLTTAGTGTTEIPGMYIAASKIGETVNQKAKQLKRALFPDFARKYHGEPEADQIENEYLVFVYGALEGLAWTTKHGKKPTMYINSRWSKNDRKKVEDHAMAMLENHLFFDTKHPIISDRRPKIRRDYLDFHFPNRKSNIGK